jgi:hypothetical protein
MGLGISPSRTPTVIWSAAVAGKVSIPRLQITALCNEVASSIGYFDFPSSEDGGELSQVLPLNQNLSQLQKQNLSLSLSLGLRPKLK